MDTKILFTDLDETLLRSDKTISSQDLASIRAITEHGHKFVVATGRPLYSAYKLCREYDFVGPGFYIIASNGSVIYDCSTESVIHRNSVPSEYVAHILDTVHEAGIHVHTYTDEHVVSRHETKELKNYSSRIKMPYRVMPDLPHSLPYDPPKVIAISDLGRKVLVPLRDKLAPWAEGKISMCFSLDTLLEFLPLNSSKGNGVKQLCELLGIPVSQAIACGDEENDISMIQVAGVGVAMQNSTDQVKIHADYVTHNTNNESAITEVINNFIL